MSVEEQFRQFLDINPHKPRVEEVRIKGYGVPIWALVGYAPGVDHDLRRVAEDYALPYEAVVVAFAWYERFRGEIDFRIRQNSDDLAVVELLG